MVEDFYRQGNFAFVRVEEWGRVFGHFLNAVYEFCKVSRATVKYLETWIGGGISSGTALLVSWNTVFCWEINLAQTLGTIIKAIFEEKKDNIGNYLELKFLLKI